MTTKEFNTVSQVLTEIKELQEMKAKLAQSIILSFKCRYFDHETKAWIDWEMKLQHSYPIDAIRKVVIQNLSARIQHLLTNFAKRVKQIISKDDEEIKL